MMVSLDGMGVDILEFWMLFLSHLLYSLILGLLSDVVSSSVDVTKPTRRAVGSLPSTQSSPAVLDPVVIATNTSQPSFLKIDKERYTPSEGGIPRFAYWIHTNNPIRIVHPRPSINGSSVEEGSHHQSHPSDIHPHLHRSPLSLNHQYPLWKTSEQAKYYQCHSVAINGGPFHADGTSCGPMVVDGELIVEHQRQQRRYEPKEHRHNDDDDHNNDDDELLPMANIQEDQMVGFGRTNESEWILGSYWQFDKIREESNKTTAGKKNPSHSPSSSWHGSLESFVTGFYWLVYDGVVVAKDDDNGKGTELQRAARTAIGTTSDGSLVILVVDGCEKCNSNPGLSLTELGQMIVARKELDVRFAINMDGGGSTTFVQNHTVQNHPHCLDVGFIPCERRVASVVCLVEPTNPKRETEERLHVTNQESDDPRIA